MDNAADIPTRYRPPIAALRWLIRLLALTAFGLSCYLTYSAWTDAAVPGCGPGSGCDDVLSSEWSKVLDLPVAALAVAIYLVILGATFEAGPGSSPARQRRAWQMLTFLAVLVLLSIAYFVAIQSVMIGTWCKWCMATHVAGGLCALLILYAAPIGRARVDPEEPSDPMMIPPVAVGGLALFALLGVVGLAAVQRLVPSDPAVADVAASTFVDTGPGPDRQIDFVVGQHAVRIEPHTLPMLGSPDAPVVFLELFDYACPHCRRLNQQLTQARQRYGDQLAIAPLAMPLDGACNPLVTVTDPRHENSCALTKIALAVWLVDRLRFAEMHAWLFDPETPPTPEAAMAFAEQLVAPDALAQALASPEIEQRINNAMKLYRLVGGSLPVLMIGPAVIQGRPGDDQLWTILETETPLRPSR